tara:strand:+ start:920 stop:1195 length:276 start_codon:yes stop_codon:yes gene_type:complete
MEILTILSLGLGGYHLLNDHSDVYNKESLLSSYYSKHSSSPYSHESHGDTTTTLPTLPTDVDWNNVPVEIYVGTTNQVNWVFEVGVRDGRK